MRPVIIFGAHNIGKIALNILQSNEWIVYGFLEDDKSLQGKTLCEVPVLGMMDNKQFLGLLGEKCMAFIAIADGEKRKELTNQLTKKIDVKLISAIHPKANLAKDIILGEGNLIDIGTSLSSNVRIGNGCIIEGHSLLAHDVTIEDFVHIGAGTMIQQGVTIAQHAYIGPGSILLPHVKISQGAYVKAGSLIDQNI